MTASLAERVRASGAVRRPHEVGTGLVQTSEMQDGPASERIRAAIAARGPITLAAFIEIALYDPSVGFYPHRAPGTGAGYVTAPVMSPAFGRCLARDLQAQWISVGRPDVFVAVDYGAGSGRLIRTVHDAASDELREALRWIAVERHDAVEHDQRRLLDGLPVRWCTDLSDVEPFDGCIVANELLDSFPIRLLRRSGPRCEEAFVEAGGDGLVLVWRPTEDIACADGYTEMRDGVRPWLQHCWDALSRGTVLIVDYGYGVAADDAPPMPTLMGYDGGVPMEDVLHAPGSIDITAHVDVGALVDDARAVGFDVDLVTTQRDFLLRLGFREELDALRDAANTARGTDSLRLHAERSAAAMLARRDGPGAFTVVRLVKRPV